MGWLDANEYLLMEAVGRDRMDEIRRAVPRARARVEVDDAPRTSRKPARGVVGCGFTGSVLCFLLSPRIAG